MYTWGLDVDETSYTGNAIIRRLVGRPAVKTWALLGGTMLAIMAVTSHDALPTLHMWLLFSGLVLLLSALCTWLLFGPGAKE